jgi:hypothetical protein
MIGVMEAGRRSRKFVSLGIINNKHSVCPLISSSSQDQRPRLDEKCWFDTNRVPYQVNRSSSQCHHR